MICAIRRRRDPPLLLGRRIEGVKVSEGTETFHEQLCISSISIQATRGSILWGTTQTKPEYTERDKARSNFRHKGQQTLYLEVPYASSSLELT